MRNILFVLLFSAALAPSATAQILLHHSRQPEPISLDSLDSSPRRVFIQFQEAPLYRVSGDRFKTASVDVYTSRLNTFLTDAGIVGIQADEANRNHVYKLVHGLEWELTERDIQRFSEFGYVKTIHRVGEYTTTETPWASAIRAPQAWTQFDTRGASVRIGIIDSGVDGTHPDLASNIRGGWDFVDQDADPSDPNGHGTHVAGIVLSVAPDADLHAYRVLDQRGRGSVAAIIQALEKSVDDGMHVVNMSLGSDIGSPFDPVSQAVDQAVKMGVVVVVSAGNSGYLNPSGDPNSFRNNGSLTIGSPGSAADAITVGSASLTGQISAFSSKGPAMVDFHPKPDVVAPGEDVLSAIPGGGRATKSGTSMAAPHVAGLAALMVSRRPDWSPAQVKSAILSSSSRLQAPAFHQGAGMVDAVNALSATTLVIPSSFAFGRVPSSEATVWVYNTSAVFKSYTASVIGAEAGVVIGVTPQQFSLATGDSLQIRATVQISEGMHPNVSGNIRFFGGRVELVSDGVVTAIPWSVAKSSIMVLQFSDPDPYVVGSAWDGFFTSDGFTKNNLFRRTTPTTAEVYALPFDTYRLGVLYGSAFVLSPSIPHRAEGSQSSVSHTLATHQIRFNSTTTGVDRRHVAIMHPEIGYFNAIGTTANDPMMTISTLDPSFLIAAQEVGPAVQVSFPSRAGISGTVTLTPSSPDIKTYRLRFKPIRDESMITVLHSARLLIKGENADGVFGSLHNLMTVPVVDGYAHLAFRSNEADAGDIYASSTFSMMRRESETRFTFEVEGPEMVHVNHRLNINNLAFTPLSYVGIAPGDTLSFGIGPVFPLIRGGLNFSGPGSAAVNPLPRGALRETRYPDLATGRMRFLNEDGSVILDRLLTDNPGVVQLPIGKVALEVTLTNHKVGRVSASSLIRQNMDFTNPDPHPAVVFMMALTDAAGQPKDRFRSGEPATFIFSAGVSRLQVAGKLDESRTKVWFRRYGTTDEWESAVVRVIPTSENHVEGSVFSADLSRATRFDRAGIEVMVELVTPAGIRTDVRLNPMFAVGDWQDESGTGTEPPEPIADRIVLHPNYPNPFNSGTTLRYDLPQSGWVRLSVHDVLGREVAVLVDELRTAGAHSERVDASGWASGMYLYRLRVGDQSQTGRMMLLK